MSSVRVKLGRMRKAGEEEEPDAEKYYGKS